MDCHLWILVCLIRSTATKPTSLPVLHTTMAGLVQRTAQSIDDMWQSIWGDSSTAEKIVIAIILIVTGLAIPVIPIVFLARIIAR